MDFYLVWYDDDRKKATSDKISDAMAAYQRRTGRFPNIVLINEQDRVEPSPAVELRALSYIRPSNFYVGFEAAA
jgi:hypothetical protein